MRGPSVYVGKVASLADDTELRKAGELYKATYVEPPKRPVGVPPTIPPALSGRTSALLSAESRIRTRCHELFDDANGNINTRQ